MTQETEEITVEQIINEAVVLVERLKAAAGLPEEVRTDAKKLIFKALLTRLFGSPRTFFEKPEVPGLMGQEYIEALFMITEGKRPQLPALQPLAAAWWGDMAA